MKISDNVPNENVVTTGDRPTNRFSDQLLELLEWLFAIPEILDFFRGGRLP